jgi:hydroxymethylbilane synthase
VPVQLPEGLTIAAVLKRGNPFDMLVCRDELSLMAVMEGSSLTIASSSIRRKAQWLSRYPQTQIEVVRGNVQTRLQKLQQSTGMEPFLPLPDWKDWE